MACIHACAYACHASEAMASENFTMMLKAKSSSVLAPMAEVADVASHHQHGNNIANSLLYERWFDWRVTGCSDGLAFLNKSQPR